MGLRCWAGIRNLLRPSPHSAARHLRRRNRVCLDNKQVPVRNASDGKRAAAALRNQRIETTTDFVAIGRLLPLYTMACALLASAREFSFGARMSWRTQQ